MEGLNGVIFVESLHYFPFILLNLVVSLRNIDGAMEESAQNLGASGWRLFRRIVFPLALPGYVAGASLVFVKVFDDLGTPLVLGTTNMLAPQAYLRITSVGIEDPIGYVISVVMVTFSVAALWASARILKGRDFATLQRGGTSLQRRDLSPLAAAGRLRLGRPGAAAGALAAPRHPADVALAGVELQRPAGGLHPRPLRDGVRAVEGHDRQHPRLLRRGGADRRRPRRGDRLPDPAHPAARTPAARPRGVVGAGHSRRGAGDRLPARLPRPGAAVHCRPRSPPARSPW